MHSPKQSTHCVQQWVHTVGEWWDLVYPTSYQQADEYIDRLARSIAEANDEDLEDVLARYRITAYSRSQFARAQGE